MECKIDYKLQVNPLEQQETATISNFLCYLIDKRKRIVNIHRKSLFKNPEDTLIISLKTDNFDLMGKVIDIAIINLNGDIQLNTNIYIDTKLTNEINYLLGISDDIILSSPEFSEVIYNINNIIKNKNLIGFDLKKDINIINHNIALNNLDLKLDFSDKIDILMQEEYIYNDNDITFINLYYKYANKYKFNNYSAIEYCKFYLEILKQSI